MRSPVIASAVVHISIDDVVSMDTSYRRRPSSTERHVYELRKHFGRSRPASSPLHLIDWEVDAVDELRMSGFKVGTPVFQEDESPEATGWKRRSIRAERDGTIYSLFYDIQ